MGFFEPLTEHDLQQAAVPSEDGVLRSPAWTGEYVQLRQLHGCSHDFEGGIQPAEPALFSDDRISVTVERVAISPIGMSIGLAARIHLSDRRINGMWPWTVVHENASTEHAPFLLARSPADVCRFGVRYSDGSWVASGTGFRDNDYVFGEADIGSHTSAQLRMITKGSSGDALAATAQMLLWPAPSDSILLKFEWPSLDIPESTLEIAKSVLIAAGESAAPLDPE